MDALLALRDFGLLTVDVLEALPLPQPGGGAYCFGLLNPVYDRVRRTLLEQSILPAHHGGQVVGKRARLARSADLRALLTDEQLRELARKRAEIRWLHEGITADRTPDLYFHLRDVIGVEEVTPEDLAEWIDEAFLTRQEDAGLRVSTASSPVGARCGSPYQGHRSPAGPL